MPVLVPPARLALFLGATLALTLTPGPAVLFIVTRSVADGRRAGFLSVLGVGLGNAVHALAATLGVAALLASSPVAFSVVRFLGAGYLVLLGVRKILERDAPEKAAAPPASPHHLLRQGFLVALLNPKTALFFLAFLPQFADPARGAVAGQILLLGALFELVAVTTDSGYVLLSGTLGAWLRRNRDFARTGHRLSGAVYIGLGAVAALVR